MTKRDIAHALACDIYETHEPTDLQIALIEQSFAFGFAVLDVARRELVLAIVAELECSWPGRVFLSVWRRVAGAH